MQRRPFALQRCLTICCCCSQNTAAHKKNAEAHAQAGRDAGAYLASTAPAPAALTVPQHAPPYFGETSMDQLAESLPDPQGHPKMAEICSLLHHLRLGQPMSM